VTDLVVRLTVAADRAELAALDLWDRGATAVESRDGLLIASFPTPAAARVVAAELGAEVEEVTPGWEDAWKAWAEAVEVPGGLVVAPAWRSVPVDDGRLVVEIDPGTCFGSGSHPSTRLLLGALVAAPPLGLDVLDVGTGSGILAVTAAILGARRVTAVDVDAEAVVVTRANAVRNGVGPLVEASTTPLAELRSGHDLALVNVTAGAHAEIGAAAVAALRPGGRLWLAGLLPGQWRHVASAYADTTLIEETALEGWTGAVVERTVPERQSESATTSQYGQT
jgi:ribosomal protein L11 methyltransferase